MIDLLTIGCSAGELVEKINEIIAALNDTESVTDYTQLENLPTINGRKLTGALSTADLDITIADTSDYETVIGNLATKKEMYAAEASVLESAQKVAKAAVADKLDADPENTSEVTMLNGDAYVYVYGDGAMKKVKLANLTNNVALSVASKDSYDAAVAQQKRILTLKGDQNGNNVDYSTEGFVRGTSVLYLNGQRMVLDTDYVETSAYAITMLTHVPIPTDRMVFIAVPIS